MSAELIIRPGHTEPSRDKFISTHPAFSIALDGYVNEPPFFDPEGPHANFDHHIGVERLATLSTSQQVLRAIRQGVVGAFSERGIYKPTVYVNDCDQDVSLAWYLLLHAPDIAAHETIERGAPLRNLVDMAGDMDVTAGAYPYPLSMPLMRSVAWMFRPFTEARTAGLSRDAEEQRQIIGQCCGRIGLYLAGRGEEVELDTNYEILGGGKTWKMIREVGAEGRIGAFRDGITALVIYKGQRPDGTHDYSFTRISEFVDFNIKGNVAELNELEGLTGSVDRWGCDGSGMVGGSPRLVGSKLGPDVVITGVKKVQKRRAK